MALGVVGCHQERVQAAGDPTPAIERATPPQDEPEPGPPRTVEDAPEPLEAFGSATELDAFVQARTQAVSSHGKLAGIGGLGLVGTGMGGGGTGEGTIGLGSTGLIGSGAGSGSGSGYGRGAGSITNNQEANVDEGGIVKVHGEHLVVLRRGRLFTIAFGDDTLTAVDGVDVGSKRRHQAWYDELLIRGDEAIVIGYSYAYRATEIARFRISSDGELRHDVTDYLRSNDYYSSRNYASRLVGDTLVFYMPHMLGGRWPSDTDAVSRDVPAVCRTTGDSCDDWQGIIEATEVYRPLDGRTATVLHTVVTCDLSRGMHCTGRGILGPGSRSFYVSQDAVYVWVDDPAWAPPPPWSPKAASMPTDAVVYRLGLSEPTVSALRTYGAPVDQFSFKQSDTGHLDVLVRAQGAGDAMWGSETTPTLDVALLRAPPSAFTPGAVATADRGAYVDLPDPEGGGLAFHNRFVGDALLYGMGADWGRPGTESSSVFVHVLGNEETKRLELSHPVDRIEPMGEDAVVVGARGNDLHFAAIDLGGTPKAAGTFTQEDANQGETRSHGFFYRPTSDEAGTVGLPVRRGGSSGGAQLRRGSAQVLFLTVEDLRFEGLGTLRSDPGAGRSDRCHTSCVDWYGNARPLFLGDRVLALLGYEVVEGRVADGTLEERRRVDMLSARRER